MVLKSLRPGRLLLVALMAATVLMPGAAHAQALNRPTSSAVAEIRERIRQQQAAREETRQRQALVPWKRLSNRPDQRAGDKLVLVRLVNAMNFFRAVWTFIPAAGNTAPPLRALLCWRGEQWIALPPGQWTGTVAVGRANGARVFRLPLAPLEGRRGEVYELRLDGPREQAVLELEHAAQRQAEEAAKHLQQAPESRPEAVPAQTGTPVR